MSELKNNIALYEIDEKLRNIETMLIRKDMEQTPPTSDNSWLFLLLALFMGFNATLPMPTSINNFYSDDEKYNKESNKEVK